MSRHIKFSSIGRDLTDEIKQGKLYKTNRKITSIGVHCTFSPQYRGDNVYTIDQWHRERWGSGIGYHFFIDEQGRTFKGRWLDYSGSHVKGYNRNSVGIVYLGGATKKMKQEYNANSIQVTAMKNLVKLLKQQYDLPSSKVLGHNEYPNVKKACPMLTDYQLNEIRYV